VTAALVTQLRSALGTVPTGEFEERVDQYRTRLRSTLDDHARRRGMRVEELRLTVEPRG
jgi:hypothetical protein